MSTIKQSNARTMTPPKLRIILLISMLIIVAIGAGLFKLSHDKLSSVAHSVAETSATANAGQKNLDQLAITKTMLEKNNDVVKKASELAVDSTNYQNKIVTDLEKFADKTGVYITSITFDDTASGSGAGTGAPAAPATPTTPAAGGAGTPPGATGVPTAGPSLQTKSATISIKTPINYNTLLQFVHDLEQNLPKMQLQNLTLTKADGGIATDSLSVEIYVK